MAGSGTSGTSDGVGTAASFSDSMGMSVTSDGIIYVSDRPSNKLRRVTSSAEVSSVVIPSAAAPEGISLDSSGNIFIAEYDGRRITRMRGCKDLSDLSPFCRLFHDNEVAMLCCAECFGLLSSFEDVFLFCSVVSLRTFCNRGWSLFLCQCRLVHARRIRRHWWSRECGAICCCYD